MMIFRRGAKGENILKIQKALVRNGLPVGCDGDYGSNTEQAVFDFQNKNSLPLTGCVDSKTLNALGVVITKPKASGQITVQILADAAGRMSSDMFASILPEINLASKIFAVNTPTRLAHFLANIGHETGFKLVRESGIYSTGNMQRTFGRNGKRSKLYGASSKNYARNPVNLFSYVYANRYGNGNEASQDGFNYRGGGLMQTTFKANYARLTKLHNEFYPDEKVDFVKNPELIVVPKYAVRSAFIWWHDNKMNMRVDRGDSVKKIRKKVNGGTRGIVDVERRFKRILRALS